MDNNEKSRFLEEASRILRELRDWTNRRHDAGGGVSLAEDRELEKLQLLLQELKTKIAEF